MLIDLGNREHIKAIDSRQTKEQCDTMVEYWKSVKFSLLCRLRLDVSQLWH